MGSILLVGTAIGFIQQRLAFRRMIDQLVNAPDGELPRALRERFKNAPSAIKSEVLAEFRAETDDRKRPAPGHSSPSIAAPFASPESS